MTAVAHLNHDEDYPAAYLAGILKGVKTIAMVGASPDATKFSYGVLRVLHETGYDMIPVNPKEAEDVREIRGLKPCRESLRSPSSGRWTWCRSSAPPRPLYGVTQEAIAIGAKVLWAQIGVRDDAAAKLAEDAGLKVVMNRCPKIELFRPFWKPRLNQQI